MRHSAIQDNQCPIVRGLDRVGDGWSMLILRDAFYGLARFDDFQTSLDIAPNILSRRLVALVEAGLLERRRYCDRPARYEYLLTPSGRDFRPVLLALLTWGNRHFAPEGVALELIDQQTGLAVDPVLIDRCTGEPLTRARHVVRTGPAASERMQARMAFRQSRRALAPTSSEPCSLETLP